MLILDNILFITFHATFSLLQVAAILFSERVKLLKLILYSYSVPIYGKPKVTILICLQTVLKNSR